MLATRTTKPRIKFALGRMLLPAQRTIWRGMARHTVIAAGRRFGKTRLGVLYIFVRALARRGVYWWVAPTYKMMRPPWRMMLSLMRLVPGCRANITERTITLPNGSIIEYRTADDPQGLVGEGLSGVVVDESGKIKELAWTESIQPALLDKRGWAMLIGTPKGKNWFYRAHVRGNSGEADWASYTFTTYDNPRIPKADIDDLAANLPPIVVQQEIMAQFVQAEGSIFKRQHYEHRPANLEYIAYYISVDTAQSVSGAASYTAIVTAGLTADYRVQLVRVRRRRLEFPALQAELEAEMRRYLGIGLRGAIVETRSAGLSLVQNMRATSPPEISRLIRPFDPRSTGSVRLDTATGVSQRKIIAAYEASVWGERGMLLLPPPSKDNADWLHDFEQEYFDFPSSEYNDQVDSTTQLVHFLSNYLAEGWRAKHPTRPVAERGEW